MEKDRRNRVETSRPATDERFHGLSQTYQGSRASPPLKSRGIISHSPIRGLHDSIARKLPPDTYPAVHDMPPGENLQCFT
jgi:hypothetical protein